LLSRLRATLFSPAFNTAMGWPAEGTAAIDAVARTAVVLAALCVQILLLLLVGEQQGVIRRARRRTVAAAAAGTAMWACLLGTATQAASTRVVDSWTEASFMLVFLGYLGFALVDVIRAARQWARSTEGALRAGLTVIEVACWLGLGYEAVKVAVLAGALIGSPVPIAVEAGLGRSLAAAGGALVIIGATLPAAPHGYPY
jgi:hypothetical protein